jgi:sulfatase maturation enzyme AslB (radical SAM superfamily)
MKLEKIGFYTLSDSRAMSATVDTPLSRCELILTDACNFRCPYCRGLKEEINKTLPLAQAMSIVSSWALDGLSNIRFSGGEPTVYKGLLELVEFTKALGVKRIAISTNGSADQTYYDELIEAGVNDFSISFDACCASFGDKMAGGIPGAWERIVENIKYLSTKTYVTLGIVVTEETLPFLKDTIEYGDSLGVSDLRIISAAQFNEILEMAKTLPQDIVDKYPILKYRVNNINNGRNVRGLVFPDSHRCGLVLDDMAIAGNYHFPCIIYMREGGEAVGTVAGKTMQEIRQERAKWYEKTDTHCDPICLKNCLDVCIDYNNKFVKGLIDKTVDLPKLPGFKFTYDIWSSGSIYDLGIVSRYASIVTDLARQKLKEHVIGWCYAENLSVRPKDNHVAVMCEKDNEPFWFHLSSNEFLEVFGEIAVLAT